jgi:hypothetical protein
MKYVALAFAVISAFAGFVAAYKWWVASRVDVRPFDDTGREIPTSDTRIWVNAIRGTLAKSGPLNKEAAIWTAVAVAFAGLSSLASAFSN